MTVDPVIAQFHEQADACRKLGSPFTGQILDGIAALLPAKPDWAAPFLNWSGNPKTDALALRVAGALHRAVLQGDVNLGAAYKARQIDNAQLESALRRHRGLLLHYLQSPPQTNDPQRSAVLLGGFLEIAARFPGLSLQCREIGASAGLNLSWNAYAYDFGSWRYGMDAAPLHLKTDWQGGTPKQGRILVQDRAGCDVAPLNARDPDQCQRLLSYIWADPAAAPCPRRSSS